MTATLDPLHPLEEKVVDIIVLSSDESSAASDHSPSTSLVGTVMKYDAPFEAAVRPGKWDAVEPSMEVVHPDFLARARNLGRLDSRKTIE